MVEKKIVSENFRYVGYFKTFYNGVLYKQRLRNTALCHEDEVRSLTLWRAMAMRNNIRIPQMTASTMIHVATLTSAIFPWNTVFTDTPSGLSRQGLSC